MLKRADLISDDYLDEQRTLHARPEGYGGKGKRWADSVIWVAKVFGCASILDYGCGQGTMRERLSDKSLYLACREYDPAIPGKDGPPEPADLVFSSDVLEHIEPEKIGNVIEHINGLARKAVFLVVCLRPSNKLLSDGVTNAHLLVRSPAWWEAKMDEHGLELLDTPDLPMPRKVTSESKLWIAVLRPRR